MSHSEYRRRDHHRCVRLYADEDAQLQAWADQLHTTVPELIRAVMFHRPIHHSHPCSEKHAGCSPQHKELVDGFRELRNREQAALEAHTGNYPGDLAHWRATGGKLTTFGDWLQAHRISATEESERGNQAAS